MELRGRPSEKKHPVQGQKLNGHSKPLAKHSLTLALLAHCSLALVQWTLLTWEAQRHFCTTLQTWDNSITVANKHWKNTEMCIGLANLKLFGPKRLLLTELQTCSLSSILYVQMWTNIIWVEVNLGNKSLLYWSSWVSALCARASNESLTTIQNYLFPICLLSKQTLWWF